MLPTLRQLQYLKHLAAHGAFSRAAEGAMVGEELEVLQLAKGGEHDPYID